MTLRLVLVPAVIALSGAFMAIAWLGHLRFKEASFATALILSWSFVLPEYVLNVAASRAGHGLFTASQLASFHIVSGVVCLSLVSRFVLGERFEPRQLAGLALLAAGAVLLVRRGG